MLQQQSPTTTCRPQELSLVELATAIRESFTLAKTEAGFAVGRAKEAIRLAVICGEYLEMARTQINHGEWYEWLRVNCPDLTAETARKYMRLANRNHDCDLKAAPTLRQAYLMAGIINESTPADDTIEPQPMRNKSGIDTIEAVLGFNYSRWHSNVFEKEYAKASNDRLKTWLAHLEQPHNDYLAVKAMLDQA